MTTSQPHRSLNQLAPFLRHCTEILEFRNGTEKSRRSSRFTGTYLMPLPYIDKMTSDGGGGGHRGRDEMGAAFKSLAALKIAV
jgi:hypothetical protein